MFNRLQYYRILFGFPFILSLAGMAAVQGTELSGALKHQFLFLVLFQESLNQQDP